MNLYSTYVFPLDKARKADVTLIFQRHLLSGIKQISAHLDLATQYNIFYHVAVCLPQSFHIHRTGSGLLMNSINYR